MIIRHTLSLALLTALAGAAAPRSADMASDTQVAAT